MKRKLLAECQIQRISAISLCLAQNQKVNAYQHWPKQYHVGTLVARGAALYNYYGTKSLYMMHSMKGWCDETNWVEIQEDRNVSQFNLNLQKAEKKFCSCKLYERHRAPIELLLFGFRPYYIATKQKQTKTKKKQRKSRK